MPLSKKQRQNRRILSVNSEQTGVHFRHSQPKTHQTTERPALMNPKKPPLSLSPETFPLLMTESRSAYRRPRSDAIDSPDPAWMTARMNRCPEQSFPDRMRSAVLKTRNRTQLLPNSHPCFYLNLLKQTLKSRFYYRIRTRSEPMRKTQGKEPL